MKDILELLKRFSNSLNQNELYKEIVVNVVFSKTNITLKPEDINIKNGVLEINSSPMVKSEINLKEESILNELRNANKLPVTRVLYK